MDGLLFKRRTPRALKPISERNLDILKIRESGVTLRELGIKFCISPARITQICVHTERKIKFMKKFGLGVGGDVR